MSRTVANTGPECAGFAYASIVTPDFAVVIVTFNSAEVIDRLLDSLPAGSGQLRAEIVVVDNGSTDQTCAKVAARTDCRLVRSVNLGYAAGINTGVAEVVSKAPILVLNPDIVVAPDSVQPLLERLSKPGVGIVVPKILESDGSLHLSLRREPTLLRATGLGGTGWAPLAEYVTEPAAYERAGPVDWALGAAMLISRECLDGLGGWDESYFLYSEETDFCLRAGAAGWQTWYEPRSVMTHAGGGSGRNDSTHVMQIINRVRFYARRHRAVPAWGYYALTVLSELSWIARGHPQSRAAVRALLLPAARPAELNCGERRLPR
jgi:N-acetylglucosaminyl-diphospho-decaprenol L-rhamnosyltransferase